MPNKLGLPLAGESEPLVAVGTCQSFGEDYPATGQVLFFRITRKPGGDTEEEEEWDAKMIYSRCAAEPGNLELARGNVCLNYAHVGPS